MIMKSIGAGLLASLIPRLSNKISEVCSDAYDAIFKREETIIPKTNNTPRKKSDTRKLTLDQVLYIKRQRDEDRRTWAELTEHFNLHFGLNKSRSAYIRAYSSDLSEFNLEQE